jgi:hypothetical protein
VVIHEAQARILFRCSGFDDDLASLPCLRLTFRIIVDARMICKERMSSSRMVPELINPWQN